LAQNFTQFMFAAGQFDNVRNIVISGINEIFHFHACDAIFREHGMFLFNSKFLEGMSGKVTRERRRALFGPENRAFHPLNHHPDRLEEDKVQFVAVLENLMTTWSLRLKPWARAWFAWCMPTPELQERKIVSEEEELIAHFDGASGITESYLRAVESHRAWHRADMERLDSEKGFNYFDINDEIGSDLDNEWLFVDRVHMTDRGYEVVAEKLGSRLASD
jgi:hypothetical protein